MHIERSHGPAIWLKVAREARHNSRYRGACTTLPHDNLYATQNQELGRCKKQIHRLTYQKLIL